MRHFPVSVPTAESNHVTLRIKYGKIPKNGECSFIGQRHYTGLSGEIHGRYGHGTISPEPDPAAESKSRTDHPTSLFFSCAGRTGIEDTFSCVPPDFTTRFTQRRGLQKPSFRPGGTPSDDETVTSVRASRRRTFAQAAAQRFVASISQESLPSTSEHALRHHRLRRCAARPAALTGWALLAGR